LIGIAPQLQKPPPPQLLLDLVTDSSYDLSSIFFKSRNKLDAKLEEETVIFQKRKKKNKK